MSLLTTLRTYKTFWISALFVIITDQISKILVLKYIAPNTYISPPPIPLIPKFFYLVHIHNTGSAWGFFSGNNILFILLAIAALVCLFIFRKHIELSHPPANFIFGLIAGGIAGNLIDRIAHGYVIDFLDVHLPFYRWPAFNVADAAITIGVALYCYFAIFKNNQPTNNLPPAPS